MPSPVVPVMLVLVLTLLSGIGDAQGFLHAAQVWQEGRPALDHVARSALGFAFGVVTYWGAVRYLTELGVGSPEVQTLLWFAVTIVGVAAFSGRFAQWRLPEQIIALAVLAGIGWLMWRTGG